MKIYTNSIDWADKVDVFFLSIIDDEELQAIKELLQICEEFNLISCDTLFNFYWGTNENFEFDLEDIYNFIDKSVTITDDEVSVLYKFNIRGFDIYNKIKNSISDIIYYNCDELSKDKFDQQILPLCRKVFDETECKSLIYNYNSNV